MKSCQGASKEHTLSGSILAILKIYHNITLLDHVKRDFKLLLSLGVTKVFFTYVCKFKSQYHVDKSGMCFVLLTGNGKILLRLSYGNLYW